MKHLSSNHLIFCAFFCALTFFTKISTAQLNQEENKRILVGQINEAGLQKAPYAQWYKSNYQQYKVDTKTLNIDKGLLQKLKIRVFMGSWCGDSKREVPRFFKIAQQLGLGSEQIEMIALRRNRKSPTKEQVGQNIHHVPTFVIYNGNTELGRIIENPVNSLEKDLVQIIQQQKPYTPDFPASEYLFALFRKQGNSYVQKNIKSIQKKIRPMAKSLWELLRVAYIFSTENNYTAAITTCHLANKLYPKSLNTWLKLAQYYEKNKQLVKAKKYYKKVLKIDQYNGYATYALKKLAQSSK